MKHLRLFVVSLAIVALFAGTITAPSYAYPGSDKANLAITVSPTGIMAIDAIDCSSATLSGNGKYYTASVSNPFLSNKCVFKISNAYVGNGAYYTLTFKGKYYFSSYTKSVSVYVKRPLLATYSTTISYKP